MKLTSRLGPLEERPFRLLFLGRTISLLGTAIAPIALAFAVLEDLDGSATELGLVLAANSLFTVAFLLVGGIWADRLPRNQVMVATDLVMFVAQGALAALLLADAARIWQIMVLQALRGIAFGFFFPASSGIVPDTVGPARLQQANALLRLSVASTGILGAAVGGALVAGIGPGWALAFDAATFLLSAACLALLRVAPAATASARHFVRELREGWDEFRSRTWLWVVVLGASVANPIAAGAFIVLGAVVAERSLGGAASWGIILAGWSAGLIVGGIVALRFRPERPLYVGVAALFLVVPTYPLLAVAAPTVLIALAAGLGGFGIEIFSVLWDTTMQEQIPREVLSRVTAYDWFGSLAFNPLGFALAGVLAGAIGTAETLWGAAALLIVTNGAVLAVGDVRGLRRRPQTLETVHSPAGP